MNMNITYEDIKKTANSPLIINFSFFNNKEINQEYIKKELDKLNQIRTAHNQFYDKTMKIQQLKTDTLSIMVLNVILTTILKSTFKTSLSNYLIDYPNLIGDDNTYIYVQEQIDNLNKFESQVVFTPDYNLFEATNLTEHNLQYLELAKKLLDTIKNISLMKNWQPI